MIRVRDITKQFGQLSVLKGISFEVEKGQVVSIVGESGAGKTTLLQIIGTLNKPNTGHIILNDTDITRLNDKRISEFRNKQIGFIFQFHNLLPEFTALENICIPGYIAKRNKKEVENRALELLKYLNLTSRLHHKPDALSGGEQQRVAVARALINDPAIILADEPSGNLDTKNKQELHELFFDLSKKFNQTFVIVTHDLKLAAMSDRTITLKDGLIVDNYLE